VKICPIKASTRPLYIPFTYTFFRQFSGGFPSVCWRHSIGLLAAFHRFAGGIPSVCWRHSGGIPKERY